MSRRPPGLKVYRSLIDADQVQELRSLCHSLPPPPANPLFRLFGEPGAFGAGKDVETMAPWMDVWGQKMVDRGLFASLPNQYRVCDWRGDLSGQFKWHIDSKRHGERLLVIALTDGRQLGFRKTPSDAPYLADFDAGDGYLSQKASRWSWEHRVMPVGQSRGGGESFILAFKRR